jgi:PadR family transcriptional regulator
MRSLLPSLLLLLIYERPGHGYDLIERLSRLGITDVEPGHVYRILRSLEREDRVVSDWVTSSTGPARRRYQLTEGGLAELGACMSQLSQLDEVVGSCLARWADASGSGECQPGGRLRAAARPLGRPAPGASTA